MPEMYGFFYTSQGLNFLVKLRLAIIELFMMCAVDGPTRNDEIIKFWLFDKYIMIARPDRE